MVRRSRREQIAIDQLRRFWDGLAQGSAPRATEVELEPAVVETVYAIHAQDTVPPVDPAFANRLLGELIGLPDPAALPHVKPVAAGGSTPHRSNGRAAPLPARWPPREQRRGRRSWAVQRRGGLIAAAVLLLAILGLGNWALDPFSAGQNRSASIPAAVAPATPAPPATAAPPSYLEVLLRVELDGWTPSVRSADLEPNTGDVWTNRLNLFRIVLEPDVPAEELMVDHGTRVLLVETGAIEATLDGPARVVRAGSTVPEPVEMTPIELREGDALVTPGGTHQTLRAIGGTGATALRLIEHQWSIEHLTLAIGPRPEELPPGPLTLTLTRLIIDPGAALPPLPAGAVAIVEIEEGRVTVTRVGAGTGGADDQPVTYDRGGDVLVGADPAIDIGIRNAGDTPVRMLIISFEPVVAAATASPAE